MRLLDIVPMEEYVTVHTAVCQEAMKFVVRWDGTLQGSGVTLHLSVRARCRLVCGWHTAVWQLIIGKRADGIVLREIDWLRNGGSKADVDPVVRRVVESLTGLLYEHCWGGR